MKQLHIYYIYVYLYIYIYIYIYTTVFCLLLSSYSIFFISQTTPGEIREISA